MKGLTQCEKGCFNEKVFGACHGYYGAELKSLIESQKGVFLWIVRNPIDRVNSICTAFAAPTISYGMLASDTNINIIELIKKYEKDIDSNFQNIINNLNNKNRRKHINLIKKAIPSDRITSNLIESYKSWLFTYKKKKYKKN